MKRLFACVLVCVFVAGCLKPLAGPTLTAIEAKADDSGKRAVLFKSMLPKIKAQLKEGDDKAATIKYLDGVADQFAKDAQSDQNIWKAIRDQHSLPKPATP
jgi:hypothetical protein